VVRADTLRWAERFGWAVLLVLVAITLGYWYFGVAEIFGGSSKVKELVLAAGILISVLLFGLTLALLHIRELAQNLVHKIHASLKESEERWSLALEGIKAGITDWDLSTDFVQYSKGWYDIVEFAEGEVGHQPDGWMQRIHPEDMPRLTEQLQDMLAGKLVNPKHEFRMLTKDGRVKWVLGHAIITRRDAAGKPLRLIGVNIDITDRKRAEATRDALLEAHVDAGVGLFALSAGRMVFANPAIAAITGYSLEELYAAPNVIDVGVHPDERERIQRKHDRRLAGSLESVRYETSIVTRSGARREIELAVTLTPDSPDFDMLGIVTDITERKQLAARLQEGHDLLTKISANVPGVIFQFRLDPDGRICYPFVSDSVQDLYGLSAAEIREDAHRVSAFLYPDDAEAVMGTFLASAQTIEPWRLEYRLVRPGRDTCWVLTEAKPEKLPDGSVVWHGITTDITEIKNMQEALHNSEERFRHLTQMSADWYWEQDEDYRFTEIAGGEVYEQVKALSAQVIGKTRWEVLANHDDPDALAAHRERLEQRKPFRNFEFSFTGEDGQTHVINISGEPHFDVSGRFVGYRGVGSDVTERKRVEEQLRLAAMVYKSSSEAMSVTAADGRVITINPAFTKITGWTAEEVVGHTTRLFNIDAARFLAIKTTLDTVGHWQGELCNQRKNGETYPAAISINTIFDRHGQPYRYVSLFSDITNRKQTEELIWRQANFDALTQLPNRSMFHERVGQEIKKARRAETQLALLFIDLDRFKEVNDTLGHDTGDQLLLKAAQRIVACVRETDAVARLGGDEFTVMLAGLTEGGSAIIERIASDILTSLAAPFILGEDEVYVSASIGITLYPEDAENIDEMFRNADQAMYLSKGLGRNRYSYFTAELQESAQHRLRLITDLRGAIAGEQFRVFFQPVVELATGRIVKAEALLRWQHPERGMVMPDQFVPLIEETGMIHEVGEWVFKEVARWAQRWKTGAHRDFQISVNKSPVQFHKDPAGHARWLAHLQELGLPGNTISIEITEGLLLNAEPAIVDALLGCRDMGIQVALDDFGTGYSSLAYLNKFDIDYLKIDQSFIANLAESPNDMALSEAIVVMAHKLGLQVIAEGIETTIQHDLLLSVGCDYGQGYLFSHPVPPEAFEELLLSNRRFMADGAGLDH
jgi:diguanylate cyclase (GGDEF)-like protein/PAS domain S-box-containing protein